MREVNSATGGQTARPEATSSTVRESVFRESVRRAPSSAPAATVCRATSSATLSKTAPTAPTRPSGSASGRAASGRCSPETSPCRPPSCDPKASFGPQPRAQTPPATHSNPTRLCSKLTDSPSTRCSRRCGSSSAADNPRPAASGSPDLGAWPHPLPRVEKSALAGRLPVGMVSAARRLFCAARSMVAATTPTRTAARCASVSHHLHLDRRRSRRR